MPRGVTSLVQLPNGEDYFGPDVKAIRAANADAPLNEACIDSDRAAGFHSTALETVQRTLPERD